MPRLMLVGRNAEKLAALAKSYGAEWTTDLDAALADPAFSVFFDAAATSQREACSNSAIAAGKHIYSEKPVALSVEHGLALLRAARREGPQARRGRGQALSPRLAEAVQARGVGFLRPRRRLPHRVRLVGVRRHGGAVPAAELELPQEGRRRAHPRYVSALALRDREHARADPPRRRSMSTATPERIDEGGARYNVDVEDNASTLIELESGATGTILSSWATRVRRDDLLTVQIDGTKAPPSPACTAAGPRPHAQTPRTAHFNIVTDMNIDYRADWHEVGPRAVQNPYRIGWENFLPHVATGAPMKATLRRRRARRAIRGSLLPEHEGRKMDQRRALVTGTSTGLGLAIAIGLARAGYDLALTDSRRRDAEGHARTHPDIAKRKAVAIALDLRSQDSIKAAFEKASKISATSIFWSTTPDALCCARRRCLRSRLGRRDRHQPEGRVLPVPTVRPRLHRREPAGRDRQHRPRRTA